jgi:uncharacterized protein DUF3943
LRRGIGIGASFWVVLGLAAGGTLARADDAVSPGASPSTPTSSSVSASPSVSAPNSGAAPKPAAPESQTVPPAPTMTAQGEAVALRTGIPANLPCPDCNVRRRWGAAIGELMIVQLIPSSVNNVLRDAEWAKISPKTWYDNLQGPWVWDDNKFLNNQFSHPYHGNLYFNSARANGFGFWGSAGWPFAGSAMWELFGEGWAPSPNDFWNTSMGGVTLGETLWHISSLTLDNTATGTERVFREIGCAVLNPIREFNRLVSGESGRVAANPAEYRPDFIQGAIDAGYRRISGDNSLGSSVATDQVFALLRLQYGDGFTDVTRSPFSTFRLRGELTDKESQGQRGRLSELEARGSLAGHQLKKSETSEQLLALFIRYEYYNNPAYEFGGQSFSGGWLGRWQGQDKGKGKRGLETRAEVLGSFYPIGATRSDFFTAEEGRDYDYGLGAGGTAAATFIWWPRVIFRTGYTLAYIHTLDGAHSDHTQGGGFFDLRVQATKSFGVGMKYFNYHRWSHYRDFPDVDQGSPALSFYVGLALPAAETRE